jgi:hypothetical protein
MVVCITDLGKTNIEKGDYNTMGFFQITLPVILRSDRFGKKNDFKNAAYRQGRFI